MHEKSIRKIMMLKRWMDKRSNGAATAQLQLSVCSVPEVSTRFRHLHVIVGREWHSSAPILWGHQHLKHPFLSVLMTGGPPAESLQTAGDPVHSENRPGHTRTRTAEYVSRHFKLGLYTISSLLQRRVFFWSFRFTHSHIPLDCMSGHNVWWTLSG